MNIRIKNIFAPASDKPYKLSRSKIDSFLKCQCCFYLDRRLGVDQVQGPAFTLNSATDTLLKKEFDVFREKGKPHPLMKMYKVDAIPFVHEKMDEWRENFKGVQYLHEPTNLLITGAIDDIWVDPKGKLLVVDYKSTSTTKEIDINDGTPWKEAYKRQMEIYQWLLEKNGFKVSDTGYWVYVNADTDQDAFDEKLVFDMQIISHKGDRSWVEKAIVDAHKCLMGDSVPESSEECEWCGYRDAAYSLIDS
ncbi:PD-(D/E)XK nuclease family protein [Patescibacteria group bacterium]|nr:PD-(D/E)XK nuclease family protein [Patescibacteria group bacterium]